MTTKAQAIEIVKVIDALIDLQAVSKILDTFYKAFHLYTIEQADGTHYLHGSLNLCGTVSGRMSHSDPNLGNVPSGSKYAKPVKECFQPPPGYLFVGADFASLEDRISALTTKDYNKLKVYTDGYDGHCLRAYGYFGDNMPDIDPNCVDSINSIAKKYPKERQMSKVPTFCLTYGGSWKAIVEQAGIPEKAAKSIEEKYHVLYKESDDWVASQLKDATKYGYVTGAFGLRLRTPVLAKTLLGHKTTPREAAAEGRTAGNMLGQSYGLLNNRAANEFMGKVWASEFKHDILPVNFIHDATYYMVKNKPSVIKFVNDHLVEAMYWQDLDAIKHPDVCLGGELDIFYPDWSNAITLPNGVSKAEIINITREGVKKYNESK